MTIRAWPWTLSDSQWDSKGDISLAFDSVHMTCVKEPCAPMFKIDLSAFHGRGS